LKFPLIELYARIYPSLITSDADDM